MATNSYYGAYVTFKTENKRDASVLLGADTLVGDALTIEFRKKGFDDIAWLVNKFGATVGYLDSQTTHQLALCRAKGWKMNTLLASTWFTDHPEPGFYWGEAVLICYSASQSDAFDTFTTCVGSKLKEGIRPAVDLSQTSVEAVVKSKGDWLPTDRVDPLKAEAGTAPIKTRQSFLESMIEKARNRNVGCMVVGWAFLLLLVLLAVWLCSFLGLF